MAKFEPDILNKIDKDFLVHPKNIFIYPTNLKRCCFKNEIFEHLKKWSNTWGLLAYKFPLHKKDPFFEYEEYALIFKSQLQILKGIVAKSTELNKHVYIFAMDGNKQIWEGIIKPNLESEFEAKDNVIFLWQK